MVKTIPRATLQLSSPSREEKHLKTPRLPPPKKRLAARKWTYRGISRLSSHLRKKNDAMADLLVESGDIGECQYPPAMLLRERFSIGSTRKRNQAR